MHTAPARLSPTASTNVAVSAKDLTRRFGTLAALDSVSIDIKEGEFFSLLGPSGCGKTTLLRLIGGLDFQDSGTLEIVGRSVKDWPAYQRPVNTVFQSYALFPHMSVRENVAFGLRMKKVPALESDERVNRILHMVQIADLADRRPHQISGGQKQRVALARAIVNEPKILLLDEPLGALDLKLRKQLQVELHQLQRRLGITFIYVTHDQDEALTMSDRIAVMNRGKIEQLGTPEELYEKPRNRFVAEFLGSCNIVSGQVRSQSREGLVVEAALGQLSVAFSPGRDSFRLQGRGADLITLAIRPEKTILFSAAPRELPNCFPATVDDVIYSGAETHYHLRAAQQEIRNCLFNSVGHERFAAGQSVFVHFPAEALIPLDE